MLKWIMNWGNIEFVVKCTDDDFIVKLPGCKNIVIATSLRDGLKRKARSDEGARTCSGKPDPAAFEPGHALRTYVCNTPILNSLVAGAWLAASMPNEIHVRVSSGSITASSHNLLAA